MIREPHEVGVDAPAPRTAPATPDRYGTKLRYFRPRREPTRPASVSVIPTPGDPPALPNK